MKRSGKSGVNARDGGRASVGRAPAMGPPGLARDPEPAERASAARRMAARHGLVPLSRHEWLCARPAQTANAGLSTIAQGLWPQAMSPFDRLRAGLKAMSKRSASNGCPAWIRTMTRRVKVACATITPPGSRSGRKKPCALRGSRVEKTLRRRCPNSVSAPGLLGPARKSTRRLTIPGRVVHIHTT